MEKLQSVFLSLPELSQDKEVTYPNVRTIPTATPDEGVAVSEEPRGTLYHHYKTDGNGVVEKVNLIMATVQNNSAMNMSIKRAAQKLITAFKLANEGLLNMVEVAFRAYDPRIACATHALPGQMPLDVIIRDARGNIAERLSRNLC